MTKIVKLKKREQDGSYKLVYPITHQRAVIDSNGHKLDQTLHSLTTSITANEDEIRKLKASSGNAELQTEAIDNLKKEINKSKVWNLGKLEGINSNIQNAFSTALGSTVPEEYRKKGLKITYYISNTLIFSEYTSENTNNIMSVSSADWKNITTTSTEDCMTNESSAEEDGSQVFISNMTSDEEFLKQPHSHLLAEDQGETMYLVKRSDLVPLINGLYAELAKRPKGYQNSYVHEPIQAFIRDRDDNTAMEEYIEEHAEDTLPSDTTISLEASKQRTKVFQAAIEYVVEKYLKKEGYQKGNVVAEEED